MNIISVYFYVFAIQLITSSAEINVKLVPIMKKYCTSAGLDMELLDLRETRYVFTKDEEFSADLMMIRRRWSDLKDAPFVELSVVLPPSINGQ